MRSKIKTTAPLTVVILAFLLILMPINACAQWETEFVDTAGKVGVKCAIAVDANGYPHISYRDGTIGWRLKYAHWDGSEWQIAFVETTESVYGVTSIAIDDAGNPHIAFDKDPGYGEQLWHAWWDGANWQQEGVDSLPWNADVGEWNSIAFDTEGYPHIAYTYYTTGGTCYLRYAYKDTLGWYIDVVDSLPGNEFQYVSMALDNSNQPHISYYDWNTYDLKYAYLIPGGTDTLWSRVYGGSNVERLYGISDMNDGSYLLCGYTYSYGAGNQDLWILKIDANGDTIWTYTYGGSLNDRTFDSLEKTSDGGYIINGTTHSFSPDGTHAMWLVKLDSTGNLEWDKSFSTGQPYDYGENGEAIETMDKGYIIAGASYSTGHATAEGFVVKTDSLGNEEWRKNYGNPDSITYFSDLIQTPDSGFLFVGGTNAYGAGGRDLYIVRPNSNGDTIWTKTYGGSADDYGGVILETPDGNYLIAGGTNSYGGPWLLKINSNGDTLWTRVYDYWYSAGISDIKATSDNCYIMVGSVRVSPSDSVDVLLIKINSSGDTLWTAISGAENNDYGSSVFQVSPEDDYIIVGATYSFGSPDDIDGYILKFSITSRIWHTERVDTAGQVGTHSSIALDSFGYPCIAYMDGTNYGVKYARWDGSTWQIETVESGIGGYYTSLALDGNDRPYISSAEYSGDLRFAYWDGSAWQIEVVDTTVGCGWTSLAIDGNGHCHIAYYNDQSDAYALKYAKRTSTGIEKSHTLPNALYLSKNYPNPFNRMTNIEYYLPEYTNVRLEIYNILGERLRTLVAANQTAGKYIALWDARDDIGRNAPSGVYFYKLTTNKAVVTKKMVLLK